MSSCAKALANVVGAGQRAAQAESGFRRLPDQGCIVVDTTPEQFYTNPGHERAEQFLSKILGH